MNTIADILAADPTLSDADALAAYLAQPPVRIQTPIQTVRSFLTDEFLTVPIRKVIANAIPGATVPDNVRDGLTAFMDGLDNALTFNGLNDKVYALTMQLVPVLVHQIPILTQQQADAIVAFVQTPVPPVDLASIPPIRRRLQAQPSLDAATAALNDLSARMMTWITTGDGAMPTVGEI